MKIIIAFIYFFNCSDKLKEVLNDVSRHSPYISVKVRYKDSVAVVVTRNRDMFNIAENLKIKKTLYLKTLCRHIVQKMPISVDENTWEKLKDKMVEPHPTVDSLKAISKKQLVEFYFGKHRILYKVLDSKERNYLLKILFDYEIYLKSSDETGYLYMM